MILDDHVFTVGLQHAAIGTGLAEYFADGGKVEPMASRAEAFGEAGRVDVHHHVHQRLELVALPVSPMYLLVTERASRIGLARSKASCLPPHIGSVPSRLCNGAGHAGFEGLGFMFTGPFFDLDVAGETVAVNEKLSVGPGQREPVL